MSELLSNLNRKRIRSTECDFISQSKYFISDQLINNRDPNRMKEIHEKTLNLLYKGISSKNLNNYVDKRQLFNQIQLLGDGNYKFTCGKDKPHWLPDKPDQKCKCCNILALIHADCTNCNLHLCEHCGLSCFECYQPLCSNCVNLFGCGSIDKPCCSRCNYFMQCD